MSQTFFNFEVTAANNQSTSMQKYKGQVILVVNVASKCGFTPQYKGLEGLFNKLKDRGFTIIAFPCNQFGAQEPATNEEIQSFCTLNYGVSFPVMAKIDVNGENATSLYQWLKSSAPGILGSEMIKWNFTKFLIDRQGQVVKRYAPQTEPNQIEADILKLL